MMRLITITGLLLLAGFAEAKGLPEIRLPDGFRIEVAIDGVPDARSMALGDQGTLFIGTRRSGRVYAVTDRDGDGRFDPPRVLLHGLRMPNGIAYRDGALYVAENHRIVRYDRIEQQLDQPPEAVVLARLPSETHHGWRYLAFGPGDRLYVAIGAPCNSCSEPGYGTIIRMRADGSERQVMAEGVRNSVGFDWQPDSGVLWFSDNGRDWLGDDLPADELNRAPEPGLHFGYPYCHAGDLPDPEYGAQRACSEFTPPALKLGAHVAALGVRFYSGEQFPADYRGQLFIAEHGSWNRTVPDGYRIGLARIEGDRVIDYSLFAEGWLSADGVSGRPVDLLVMPDGALLVSDDHAGVVYRITYTP
ncbi:PQQ-dependent sugar dehydrogenase [Sedimenticola thiotaurini]|uniref:Sorbosone dehydrogenase n=1 Tax=Sedimenticola thiotaurini TaxID=1543721 RepID=A0A0F7K0Q5_9GAMM|nr:PQQ-dependent sugar dehydrogenase [Sedimenticola thiotaurini]AKH21487.1 sorbosone dehydrogenase [Sedimenticola thiotaurini]